jgi:type IV pilus assembly protein PilA
VASFLGSICSIFLTEGVGMKAMRYKSKLHQAGFTLVEVGIVVAIGLLLLLGIGAANRTIAGTKVNNEIGEIKTIIANVQRQYSGKSNYATATLTDIIALKSMPDERKASATTAVNRWSGAITMAPATITTANDSIRYSSAGVPEYECTQIVPQVEGSLTRVAVAGTDVKAAGGQLNQTTLGTQCAGGNVTIDYYFPK